MTPEDFLKLGEHLATVDELLLSFCKDNGFFRNIRCEGRYPRRRLEKLGHVNLFFDLQMEKTAEEGFYSTYFPEIPYSLACGAWFDISCTRYSKVLLVFEKEPFVSIAKSLRFALYENLEILKLWDEDYLVAHGTVSNISNN